MTPLNDFSQDILKAVSRDLQGVHGKIYPGPEKSLLAVNEGRRVVSLSYSYLNRDTDEVVYDPIFRFWHSQKDEKFYFVSFHARGMDGEWAIKFDSKGNPFITDDDVEELFRPKADNWLIKINELHRITNQ